MTEKQEWKKTPLPVSTEMEASLSTAGMIAVGSDAFHVKWLTEHAGSTEQDPRWHPLAEVELAWIFVLDKQWDTNPFIPSVGLVSWCRKCWELSAAINSLLRERMTAVQNETDVPFVPLHLSHSSSVAMDCAVTPAGALTPAHAFTADWLSHA